MKNRPELDSQSCSPIFIKKLLGYVGVGGAAACVDITVFCLAKYLFGFNYIASLIIGFIPGMMTNFILCNWLLFHRVKRNIGGAFFFHMMASLFSLSINMLTMVFLIQVLHIDYFLLARIIAIGVGFIVSFITIRYFAFRDHWFYRR